MGVERGVSPDVERWLGVGQCEGHVRIGRRAGLTAEELGWIEEGPSASGWPERERTLLAAVDELHETQDVGEATWSALRGLYDDRRLIELVMLAGHYEMLATVIGTLRIQPDGVSSGRASA